MKTKFENLNQLKKEIKIGQKIYIENFVCPNRSRVTKVIRKQSYFFTVDFNGKESWIINGVVTLKNFGFSFNPEFERIDIYTKKDNKPFVSIHFNETIIKGKENL
jgi:hypothetical protein